MDLKGSLKSCKMRQKSLKSMHQTALEIFKFIDRDLDNFTRKNDRKTENVGVFNIFAQIEEQQIV